MATRTIGYGPEQSDRDVARLDTVLDGMLEHLKVFDQKKVSAEDTKKAEGYKNGASMVVRGINVRLECLVASGRTAAQRKSLEMPQGKKSRSA